MALGACESGILLQDFGHDFHRLRVCSMILPQCGQAMPTRVEDGTGSCTATVQSSFTHPAPVPEFIYTFLSHSTLQVVT